MIARLVQIVAMIMSICFVFPSPKVYAQAVQFSQPIQTSGPNVPTSGGALPQTLWVANAKVVVCAHVTPASMQTYVNCLATPITTYTDSSMATSCPLSPTIAQMVELPGIACTASSGVASTMSFWAVSGTYDYYVISSYGTFGPYNISQGGAGGAGGDPGTVNAVQYCAVPGTYDQTCVANALAAGNNVVVPAVGGAPTTYTFASSVVVGSNKTVTCLDGVTLLRTTSAPTLIATGTNPTITGCTFDGGDVTATNPVPQGILLIDHAVNATADTDSFVNSKDIDVLWQFSDGGLLHNTQATQLDVATLDVQTVMIGQSSGVTMQGGNVPSVAVINGYQQNSVIHPTSDVTIDGVTINPQGNLTVADGAVGLLAGDFTGGANITAFSIDSSSVITITQYHPSSGGSGNQVFHAGDQVHCNAMTVGTYLDFPVAGYFTVGGGPTTSGYTLTSPTFHHAAVGTTADTGICRNGMVRNLKVTNSTCNITNTSSSIPAFGCWSFAENDGLIFTGNSSQADGQYVDFSILELGYSYNAEVGDYVSSAVDSIGGQSYTQIADYVGNANVHDVWLTGFGAGTGGEGILHSFLDTTSGNFSLNRVFLSQPVATATSLFGILEQCNASPTVCGGTIDKFDTVDLAGTIAYPFTFRDYGTTGINVEASNDTFKGTDSTDIVMSGTSVDAFSMGINTCNGSPCTLNYPAGGAVKYPLPGDLVMPNTYTTGSVVITQPSTSGTLALQNQLSLPSAASPAVQNPTDITQGTWSKVGATATSATLLTVTNGTNYLAQNVAVTPGMSYIFQFQAKAGTLLQPYYEIWDATHNVDVVPETPYIAQLNPSTWSLVSITFTAPPGATTIELLPQANTGTTYTGTLYLTNFTLLQMNPLTSVSSANSQVVTCTPESMTPTTDYCGANGVWQAPGSGTFTALSGDATSTATGGATTVQGLKGIPFCTGFTPTNLQFVQFTTASSPNPCYTAASGGGGGGGGTGSTIYSSIGSTALGVAACTNYTNINTGGGTSASACLQAQLDALGALPSGGTLIIDHYYLIDATNVGSGSTTNPVDGNIQTTALQTHSNVTIDATNGGVFLAAASDVTMLGNNITGNPAATFQTNMQVIGGIWNQNQANQSKYELGTSTNAWGFGMWFGGFNGLTLNGVTVLNATTFCGTLSNGANAVIENTTCQWASGTVTNNHDGWHFWGTLDRITETDFSDNGGNDDTIPINTSEGCANHNSGVGIVWQNDRYPWSGGNITNLTVDGVVSNSPYNMRWWNGGTPGGCTSYVSNIIINNYRSNVGNAVTYKNITGTQGPISLSNWNLTAGTFGIGVPQSSALSISNIYPGVSIDMGSSTLYDSYAQNAHAVNLNLSGSLNSSANTGDTYYTGGGILSVLPAQTTTDIDCYLEQGTGSSGHAPYWGPCSGGTAAFTLTTLGTSGAASYTGGVLNIPQYSGGGGGGITPVTVSGVDVNELDVTSCISPSYNDYQIRFDHLVLTAGSSVSWLIQFSSDNGLTWDTSSSYYAGRSWEGLNNNNYGQTASVTGSGIAPSLVFDTYSTGDDFSGVMTMIMPQVTTRKFVDLHSFTSGGANSYHADGGAMYSGTSSVNALRIILGSGGTMTGSVTCQPLAK
jgi:hypothetical protein